jgi:hypothetical protein
LKKILVALFVILTIIALTTFYFYKFYLPELVANVVTGQQSTPDFIPEATRKKIEEIKTPVNKGAESFVREIHKAEVPFNQVILTVEGLSEDQASSLVDQVRNLKAQNPDELFDIIKVNVNPDYDIEPLRKSFNQKVNAKTIKTSIAYYEYYRNEKLYDFETVKSILINVLRQKEEDYQSIQADN